MRFSNTLASSTRWPAQTVIIMTTHLIHAATMPKAGLYTVSELTDTAFFNSLMQAHDAGRLVNCIAYPGNLDLVFQRTRIDLQPEVRALELADNDELLIMRLSYDPRTKPDRRRIVGPQDFIFQRAVYHEQPPKLPPMPEWLIDSVEALEPEWAGFLMDYLQAAHGADRAVLERLEAEMIAAEQASDDSREALHRACKRFTTALEAARKG